MNFHGVLPWFVVIFWQAAPGARHCWVRQRLWPLAWHRRRRRLLARTLPIGWDTTRTGGVLGRAKGMTSYTARLRNPITHGLWSMNCFLQNLPWLMPFIFVTPTQLEDHSDSSCNPCKQISFLFIHWNINPFRIIPKSNDLPGRAAFVSKLFPVTVSLRTHSTPCAHERSSMTRLRILGTHLQFHFHFK